MIKKQGGFYTDAELYPEQFCDLPYEKERGIKRNRAVKLGDIDLSETETRNKSVSAKPQKNELKQLLCGTAPRWKVTSEKEKNAVNAEKNVFCAEEEIRKVNKQSARACAMKIVSVSAVTEKRLYGKLIQKGYAEEEASEALEYVKGFGYVNDKRMAQDMLPKLAERHWGKFKICRYLAGKGIEEDVISELDFSEIDFAEYCARLMGKYPPERREAMLRAVKNAGYSMSDYREAKRILEDKE